MTRAPFFAAGAIFAMLFAWQSCQVLVREPAHPKAERTQDDYPLGVGYTWVYKSVEGFQVVRQFVAEKDGWFDMRF